MAEYTFDPSILVAEAGGPLRFQGSQVLSYRETISNNKAPERFFQ